jgi:hypothetical protein
MSAHRMGQYATRQLAVQAVMGREIFFSHKDPSGAVQSFKIVFALDGYLRFTMNWIE